VNHVIAVLGLVAACILWYLVQRWAAPEDTEPCQEYRPDCGSCALHGSNCPSLAGHDAPPAKGSRAPTTR
jgi:hypothetical protein